MKRFERARAARVRPLVSDGVIAWRECDRPNFDYPNADQYIICPKCTRRGEHPAAVFGFDETARKAVSWLLVARLG